MKYIVILIAIVYLLFGLWVSLDNAQLLFNRGYFVIFSQIESFKTPIVLIGGLLALVGSIMAFKRKISSVWLLLLSLIAFVIGASYDVIIKHGIYFYLHLIPVFYLAVIFRLATVVALYYAIKKLLTNTYSRSLRSG